MYRSIAVSQTSHNLIVRMFSLNPNVSFAPSHVKERSLLSTVLNEKQLQIHYPEYIRLPSFTVYQPSQTVPISSILTECKG